MTKSKIFEKKGGYALCDWNVTRIAIEHIIPTLEQISTILGIPLDDLHLIGSSGKLETSGDIDITIDTNKYDFKQVITLLEKYVGEKFIENKNTNVFSFAIPVTNTNSLVQLDIMPSHNIEWTKFIYYSPGHESEYKGAVRTILLSAIVANINQPDVDYFKYEGGQLIIRVGRVLNFTHGITRIYQYRQKKKNGSYKSSMTSITEEQFNILFPDIHVLQFHPIDDPLKALRLMFGTDITLKQVNTTEQIIELIKTLFSDDDQRRIFHFASQRAPKDKFNLPPEFSTLDK